MVREIFYFFLVLMQMGPNEKNIMTLGCETYSSRIRHYYNEPLHEVPLLFQNCIPQNLYVKFRGQIRNFTFLI